jgi:hypothetical protein
VLVNYTVPADPQTKTPETKGTVRVTVKEQYCAFPHEDPTNREVLFQEDNDGQGPTVEEAHWPTGWRRVMDAG